MTRKYQSRVREKLMSNNQEPVAPNVIVTPQAPVQNIDVMAYRLEQNEKATEKLSEAITKGLKELSQQISDYSKNFVTHGQLHETEEGINTAITTVASRVTALENERTAITKQIAKTSIYMFVLMVAALYGLDKFLKF